MDVADKIIADLVNAVPVDKIRTKAIKLGVNPKRWGMVLAECRRKISLAANYNRDEKLALSISRLEYQYAQAVALKDGKLGIQAQRELNKLLGLYHAQPAAAEGPEGAVSQDDALVRGYLAPLVEGGEELPLPELARLAAQRIINA